MTGQSGEIGTDVTSGVIYRTFGSVPAAARDEAEKMMRALTEHAPRPILHANVRVRNDDQRDPDQHSIAQGTMDVSGRVIRAEGAAATAVEAMRIVGSRLERRLNVLAERRKRSEKRPPSTPQGSWRCGDLPERRPAYLDRPKEERRVMRRKTYSPSEEISISEALFDLDVMDYCFFLFTDEADGIASVVSWADSRAEIQKIDGSPPDEPSIPPEVTVNMTPAPYIPTSEAVSRLNSSDAPFIFFRDADRNGAGVLYRRYDGHYGLIAPRVRID